MRKEKLLLCALLSTFHILQCATQNVRLSLTGLVEPDLNVGVGAKFKPGVITPERVRPGIDGILTPERARPGIDAIATPSRAAINQAIQSAKTVTDQAVAFEKQQVSLGNFVDKSDNQTPMFGPHLVLLGEEVKQIGLAGDKFLQAAKGTLQTLGVAPSMARESLRKITIPDIDRRLGCPFSKKLRCSKHYKYRQADGSCNNLKHPLWGRRNTPFERFIPAFYDDGIQSPRETSAVSGGKLPGARQISVTVHTASSSSHEMDDLNHLTMLYGQFVSHDIQMNALSRGYGGSNMDCCRSPNRRNCFPIMIDKNDPHFGRFQRRCMNMVRALATPNLDCKFGQREQLNQVSHFLDASHIYGSDSRTMNNIRTGSGGKLNSTGGNLLPKDLDNNAACILTNPFHKCFIAGDVRVNQQPMLMALHTIWLKEHNRVAERLSIENRHWHDEKLFQEARKIVIAEFQHITYNEYLPEILGSQHMARFDLNPRHSGYFTGYDDGIKPQIRNVFAAAAFRFGHSMIRDKVAYRKVGQTTRGEYLFRTFLRPDLIYSPGVEGVTRGLYEQFSQSVDRHFSPQVTNHLFERQAGFGGDLAAINIQRGRDHGIANYNTWRMACGLSPVQKLWDGGPVQNHDADPARAMSLVYSHPDDFDVFTAGVSENPVPKGKVGPLFACLIGLQFKALKYGDRFYYETNDTNVGFTTRQLAEIRKTTMARVICDNTNTDQVPTDVFRKAKRFSNVNKRCTSFVKFDFLPWKDCVDGGWSAWTSVNNNRCIHRRRCDNPRPQTGCGKICEGLSSRFNHGPGCGGIGIGGGGIGIGPITIRPPFVTLPPRLTIRPPFWRVTRPQFELLPDRRELPGLLNLAK